MKLAFIKYLFFFQHAAVALSAFINGMYELNTVAIVRYCRQKNAAPKLGFLSPHIKQDYEVHINSDRNISISLVRYLI